MKKISNKDGIAAWKIDSATERRLAKKADNSEYWKRKYVDYYKKHDSEYYNKGLKFIDKNIAMFKGEVSDEQRDAYVIDMVYSLHRFGCMFDEYFAFKFEFLNAKGREEFVTDKIRWDYYDKMNSRENLEIFNDKKKAYDTFKEFYKRELVEISDADDLAVFDEFWTRHKNVIVKPKNGSGGKGIFVIKEAQYPSSKAAFETVLSCGENVVEELIVQDSIMGSINPCSVNTVRVPTLKTKDGVIIFHPFLRCGCGTSVVDNAASGGIFAEIDPETGIVITKGTTEAGVQYIKHPISDTVFPGFKIPRWDEAVALVNKLAYVLETNNYVGWDIALTPNGWIMVEGNPRGQLVSQYASGVGIRKELEYYIDKM